MAIKKIKKFLRKKLQKPEPQVEKRPFNPMVRKDSEHMTEKEKMDQGFDGKAYIINGLEGDW